MVTLFSILAIGLLLGMRHATDPDHVIAVSTIVTREQSMWRSALIGAAWGLGHTLTIMAVGGAIILFRITLTPRVGLSMELAVGVMLIWLGLRNIRAMLNTSAEEIGAIASAAAATAQADPATHPHEDSVQYHQHGDYVHAHGHAHSHAHPHDLASNPVAALDRIFHRNTLYLLIRPLLIGMVHGMAGSAAVALLVLGAIPSPYWATAYLAVFGVGTIIGMMLITLSLGSTIVYGQRRFLRINRHFGLAAGAVSLVFGVFIAYHIGFVDGLFTSHAHWIPQ